MLNISYFIPIFVTSIFVVIGIVIALNKKATRLRKAWNVYGAMYIIHSFLFLGMMLILPAAFPSQSSERYETGKIETIDDVRQIVKEQRDDIEQLRNDLHQLTEAMWISALILLMFAPMLYYNLIKYNLEIEKLSGKRMGSFD